MCTPRARGKLVRYARARLASIRARAHGDPSSDPFAAKSQQLRNLRAAGELTYSPEILAEAMNEHDWLMAARSAANRAMLLGVDASDGGEVA